MERQWLKHVTVKFACALIHDDLFVHRSWQIPPKYSADSSPDVVASASFLLKRLQSRRIFPTSRFTHNNLAAHRLHVKVDLDSGRSNRANSINRTDGGTTALTRVAWKIAQSVNSGTAARTACT